VEYLLAGASAVQVGTATFIQPAAMVTIIDDLAQFCQRRGIARVKELIGAMQSHGIRENISISLGSSHY
jgi:dihydroorotate dehydrogenase (NAD+) catalytic subunit